MAALLFPPGYQINDNNGNPQSGALINVYEAGTTTRADIWQDLALSSAHANPVVCDSSGRVPDIYVDGLDNYKVVVTKSDGSSLFDSDDVPPAISSATNSLPVNKGGTGATDAATARTNLGAASSTEVSTLSSTVSSATTLQTQATWEAGTGTTETVVSPAKVKAAIETLQASQSGMADAIIYDEKSQNTDGGTFTAGAWQIRTLNTKYDPNTLITLSSNTFEASKDGIVYWSAPAYDVNRHQTRLYNVTDAVVVQVGTCELTADPTQTRSFGWGVIESGKVYRLEHQCQTTQATTGFGVASNFGDELYTEVKFFSENGS